MVMPWKTEELVGFTLTCMGYDVQLLGQKPSPDIIAWRFVDKFNYVKEVLIVEVKGYSVPFIDARQLEAIVTLARAIDHRPYLRSLPIVAIVGGGVVRFYDANSLASLMFLRGQVDKRRKKGGEIVPEIDVTKGKLLGVVAEAKEPCRKILPPQLLYAKLVSEEMEKVIDGIRLRVSRRQFELNYFVAMSPVKDFCFPRIGELFEEIARNMGKIQATVSDVESNTRQGTNEE